jgi:hypothetical protein
MLYAKKIAQGKGIVIPEDAKANSSAMSAWIDSNRGTKRRSKRGRKTAYKSTGSVAPRSTCAGEEVPETHSERRRRNVLTRPASWRNRDATPDSIWQ